MADKIDMLSNTYRQQRIPENPFKGVQNTAVRTIINSGIGAMRTELSTGYGYSDAHLDAMSPNDMVYALRKESGTLV